MPDIMHFIKTHASPERVHQALTTVEGIRNWRTRDADLDSKIGGTGEFRFYEGKGATKLCKRHQLRFWPVRRRGPRLLFKLFNIVALYECQRTELLPQLR